MGMQIKSTLTPAILDNAFLAEAARLLVENNISCANVVNDSGDIVGFITRFNLLTATVQAMPSTTRVKEIMEQLDWETGLTNYFYDHSVNSTLPYGENDSNLDSDLATLLMNHQKEWQSLLNAIPYPTIYFKKPANIKFLNQTFVDIFGITLQDISSGDIEKDFSFLSKLINTQSNSDQVREVRFTYQYRVYWSTIVPVSINKKVTGAIAVLHDMSQFQKLFQELSHVKGLNRQLDHMFNSSFDGLYITDGNGITLRLNRAFERITGITANDCMGRRMADLVKEGYLSRSATLMALKNRQTVTTPLQSKTGKQVLVTSTPIFDDEGNIVLVVTNVRDMTELVKLQQKLEEVEGLRRRELDAIFDSSYDGLYITDGDGLTLRLNKAFERITGVTAYECVGRNMADLVKEGYFSRSGTLLALEKRQSVTVQLQASTGKQALVTSTPIFDDNGDILLVVTNVRDMTELLELQQKLEQVEGLRQRELDAIFDSSYDGLYITDGTGVTLRLNKAFERITGVTAEECVGRNMAELVKEGYFSRSGTLLALEKRQSVTVPLQAKTGKHALVTSTPIFDDNNDDIVLVVTNVRDLTELNHLQERVEQLETLSRVYQAELQQLRMETSEKYVFSSPKMREMLKMLVHIASVDSTVLIQGESGVGKEVVADILHAYSHRRDMPFIKINCAAIPQNLLESELFGYEPGSFTGADKRGKIGLFELASGGTLFLDEIAELPLDLQVKLLRVLQDNSILRVGGTKSISVDVRILTGTNRNLTDMVAKNQFREDLFYRLNVVPILVPPLRERKEDIPVFCAHFLDIFNKKYNMQKRLTSDLIHSLTNYHWPGNVRELRNLIERLVVTTLHDLIDTNDLYSWWSGLVPEEDKNTDTEIIPLQEAVENTERKILQAAFRRCTSTYEVARILGISQPTVVRKASKYGIIRRSKRSTKIE